MADELKWLRREIGEGLMKLLPLRLDGAPAADTITATARAWLTALMTTSTVWNEQLDRRRIQQCFEILMRECTNWPQPKQFLFHLPARKQMQPALSAPGLSKEDIAANRKRFREITERLAVNKKPPYMKGKIDGKAKE